METLAFRTAQRQEAERAGFTQRHQRQEPMLALSGPNRKSRCVSRTWPKRGLPWRAALQRADVGVVGCQLAQERLGFDVASEAMGEVSTSTE